MIFMIGIDVHKVNDEHLLGLSLYAGIDEKESSASPILSKFGK